MYVKQVQITEELYLTLYEYNIQNSKISVSRQMFRTPHILPEQKLTEHYLLQWVKLKTAR
jgi:hypothetical protein